MFQHAPPPAEVMVMAMDLRPLPLTIIHQPVSEDLFKIPRRPPPPLETNRRLVVVKRLSRGS